MDVIGWFSCDDDVELLARYPEEGRHKVNT